MEKVGITQANREDGEKKNPAPPPKKKTPKTIVLH